MKKIILMLGFALFFMINLALGQRCSVGILAGPNIVRLSGEKSLNKLKSNYTFYSGICFNYPLSPSFSIQSNVAFERKGCRLPNTVLVDSFSGNTTGEVTPYINFDYLTTPILLEYSVGKKMRYYWAMGLYLGYLLNRKDIAKGDNVKKLVLYSGKDYDKSWDWGASIGAGFTIPLPQQFYLNIETLYNKGLRNIIKKGYPANVKIYTNSINLSLGISYLLPNSKKVK